MQDSEKLDLILKMVHTIDEKVSDLDAKVDNLETKVDDLDDRVERLESETREIRQKVTKMDLIMENELRVNIQRVAEGHLDLSRNLHEAMKPNNEIEMLAIKVRMLESEVRDIKARFL